MPAIEIPELPAGLIERAVDDWSFGGDFFAALDAGLIDDHYRDPPRRVSEVEWQDWLRRARPTAPGEIDEQAPTVGGERDLGSGNAVLRMAVAEAWRERWRPREAERFSDYVMDGHSLPPWLSEPARIAWVRFWQCAGCAGWVGRPDPRWPLWPQPWWVEAMRRDAEVAITPPDLLSEIVEGLLSADILDRSGPGSGPWPWDETRPGLEEIPGEVVDLISFLRLSAARGRWLLAFAWP